MVMSLEIPRYPLSDSFGETGGHRAKTLIQTAMADAESNLEGRKF
jgi:hypothetical protein